MKLHMDPAELGRRAVPVLLPVLVGLVGAWLAMRVFAGDTTRMGAFTVELASGFGRGETIVALPPLGEVRLNTHDSPLRVRATVANVDVERLTEDLKEKSTRAITGEVESDARSSIRPFALRLLAVATGGGLVAGLVVFRRRWRPVVAAGATAVMVVGASEAVAWTTFRPEAFAEPTFEGTLRLAPQLLGPAEEITERLDAFRANLDRIVRGAIRAYSALEPQAIGGRDEVRVLHISDIHLNTLGMDFAVGLARGFDVDLVVDTGDLTSYGTPLEEAIASQIPRFGRPYVFVRGNHDPPALVERIEATGNGRVLERTLATVSGLRIYGEPHPVFTEDGGRDVDSDAVAEGSRAAGPRLRDLIDELDAVPDVVAVHDDRMAQELVGRVPVVLSGHFHKARASSMGGTLYLRAGSTGGAGVNMFRDSTPVPLSATVLYFERDGEADLIAYDLVQQSPTTGRLIIQRHLVAEVPEVTPSPAPTPTVAPG